MVQRAAIGILGRSPIPVLKDQESTSRLTAMIGRSLRILGLGNRATVSTSHKAQTIGTTRHLYALRPLVHSASYRPGRHAVTLDVNFKKPLAEASIGPIEHYGVWFPMQPSRLGSGLEAFSHNPSSGSITALSDRTTVDTRDLTWEFLSYYPRLLSGCTGPRAHSPSVG